MLKPYYYKVQAVKITRKNYQKLKELDSADGVLDEGHFEDFEGDWFVNGTNGYEIWAGNLPLIPLGNQLAKAGK